MPEETPAAAVPTPQADPAAPAEARPASAARPSAPGARAGGRRPFAPRRKVCRFCAEQVADVDFKQVQLLRTFTTERGKILSSRITGTCAKHQRQLTRAVKRARSLALLPYVNV